MRLINIGFANINTHVGAFKTNTDKVIEFMKLMKEKSCTIGCFQEQVISGYPSEDLIQWHSFVDAQWTELNRVLDISRSKGFNRTAFILGITVEQKGNLYNSAVVICDGKVLGIVPKEKLPTYGIFYEWRTFSPGIPYDTGEIGPGKIPFGDLIFRFPFGTIGVEVCEDLWSPDGPARRRAYSGAEVIVNVSSSPFRIGVENTRKEMISTRAADNQMTLVYVNQVGGNDSLVFDGGGYVNQNGHMLAEAPRWREGFTSQTVDLNRTQRLRHENTTWRIDYDQYHRQNSSVKAIEVPDGPKANQKDFAFPLPADKSFFMPSVTDRPDPLKAYFNDLIEAMITGLDYFDKTKAFKKIGIALSGGKDSLLTLLIVYMYAKRKFSHLSEKESKKAVHEFIACFSLPSQFNSDTTKDISRKICLELDVSFREIPIQEQVDAEKEAVKKMLSEGETLTEMTEQNIQARIRGEHMMNWTNSSGGMWIQTGNMTEKAVGYTTVGGDMMGAYSLIANLPKTVVIALLRYIHAEYGIKTIADVLNTKASAELAADQEDEKDLMPFDVLDSCMYLFVEEKKSPLAVYKIMRAMWSDDELKKLSPAYSPGTLKKWVLQFCRLFTNAIFKWVQTPQAVHVGKLELDRERALQLPVVQSREWLELEKWEDS
ncbi:MAG: NAD(+) synthase [Spirochaetales bacterium]|nr:NAD(+) synthase [Spirochaetales bacterium]